MPQKQPEGDDVKATVENQGNPENPSDRTHADQPEETRPEDELKKLQPGQFIPLELVMRILRSSRENSPVRLRDFNFDEEQSPDSTGSANPPEQHNTDKRANPFESAQPEAPKLEEHNRAQKPEEKVITVPEDKFTTDPPPSFMERDTNRPPRRRDLRNLADYLSKKKTKKTD